MGTFSMQRRDASLLLVAVGMGVWLKHNVAGARDGAWLARGERDDPAQLFAWAYDLTPEEVHRALEYFPNLGAVLYSSNYGAAAHPGSWIAYVRDESDARLALATLGRWRAFIVADELNSHGQERRPWSAPSTLVSRRSSRHGQRAGVSKSVTGCESSPWR